MNNEEEYLSQLEEQRQRAQESDRPSPAAQVAKQAAKQVMKKVMKQMAKMAMRFALQLAAYLGGAALSFFAPWILGALVVFIVIIIILGPTGVGVFTPTVTSREAEVAQAEGWYWDSGIEKQWGHASPELQGFLNCMREKLPERVGRISSISDSHIFTGTCNWCSCGSGCQHTCGSCHYGGSNCCGQSYAVDFGDQFNERYLREAAQACEPDAYILNEGDHLHISIGAKHGCGCN